MIKWDEVSEVFELIRIDLWSGYVYATMIICNTYIYFVEVFEHVCFVSMNFLESEDNCENRRTLSKNIF